MPVSHPQNAPEDWDVVDARASTDGMAGATKFTVADAWVVEALGTRAVEATAADTDITVGCEVVMGSDANSEP